MFRDVLKLTLAFFGCPIATLVFLGITQGMVFIREHLGLFGIFVVLILAWAIMGIMGKRKLEGSPTPRIERVYKVRRKSDGYPMTVNISQRDKAIATGDYIYEGPDEDAGGYYYSGETEYHNTWIPQGYRPARNQRKLDQRLN